MPRLNNSSWGLSAVLSPTKIETIVVGIYRHPISIIRIGKDQIKKENCWAGNIECKAFENGCRVRDKLQELSKELIVNVNCTERQNDVSKGYAKGGWKFSKIEGFDEEVIGVKVEDHQLDWPSTATISWANITFK